MSLAHAKFDVIAPQKDPSPNRARKRRRRVDPAILISLFAVVVLASALFHVGQRAKLAALSYEMHQALTRLDQLQREQTRLLVEIERAHSLERIEADARVRLGMDRPQTEHLVVVHPLRTSPDAETASRDSDNLSWMAAISGWYDRVSTQIRAALPSPAWNREGR